jgi:WXG100 family type VII secretion target
MTGPDFRNFHVATEDVQATATSVQQTVHDIEGELFGLRSFVDSTGDYWQGSDQLAFIELLQSFDVNAYSLSEALDSISTGLHANASKYNEAGDVNKAGLNNIDQTLPPAQF